MSASLLRGAAPTSRYSLVLGALLSFLLCLNSLGPSPASAQPPAGSGEIDALDAAARAIFEDGRRAFEAGDFETALTRFQNAYDISHRPLLLWNIATTLDRLRRDEEALATFQQYLDAVPDAANRTEVLGRIRSLQDAVDAERAEEEAAAAERAAREAEAARLAEERAALERERASGGSGGSGGSGDDTSSGGGGLTPIVFGVGAGLTAISAGILIWSGIDTLAANDNYVTYTNATGANVTEAERLFHSAEEAQLRTNVMVGVTSALGVATVVLAIFTDWDGDPPAASPAPSSDGDTPAPTSAPAVSLVPVLEAGPGSAYVGLGGTF